MQQSSRIKINKNHIKIFLLLIIIFSFITTYLPTQPICAERSSSNDTDVISANGKTELVRIQFSQSTSPQAGVCIVHLRPIP